MDYIKLKNGVGIIDENLLSIPIFKNLFMKDKGSIGDADGRKKYGAFKEIGLLWYINHPASPGNIEGYNDKDLIKFGKMEMGLPDNWKASSYFTDVDKWIKSHQGIAVKTYRSLIKALGNSQKLIDEISNRTALKLMSGNMTDSEISSHLSLQKEVMLIASKIVDTMGELDKAKNRALSSEKSLGTARGGTNITISMVPSLNTD